MASRRKRKRYRRAAAPGQPGGPAPRGGDRKTPPAEDFGKSARGVGGPERGLWAGSNPSDLLLLRKAIREGWPVPYERRSPILAEALSPIGEENTPFRLLIAIARLALDADKHNLALERAEQDQR